MPPPSAPRSRGSPDDISSTFAAAPAQRRTRPEKHASLPPMLSASDTSKLQLLGALPPRIPPIPYICAAPYVYWKWFPPTNGHFLSPAGGSSTPYLNPLNRAGGSALAQGLPRPYTILTLMMMMLAVVAWGQIPRQQGSGDYFPRSRLPVRALSPPLWEGINSPIIISRPCCLLGRLAGGHFPLC